MRLDERNTICFFERVLFFSGIDGSGKSTHAKLLSTYLKRRGVKVRLVWMRWFAFFSYPLLALCRILRLTKRTKFSAIPLRLYWLYKSIAMLWTHLFLLDYLLYVLIVLALNRRKVVIADRFMLDVFVDVAYDTHLNPVKYIIGKFFLLLLYRLMKKGLLKGVVMIVDKDVVFARRRDVPSKTYVTFRIPVYVALASWLGVPVINGSDDIIKNFLRITKILGVDDI